MKQVLQSLRTGVTEVADVPCPVLQRGHLLIRTSKTLVSPGTERMLLEFAKGGLFEKARQQPDKMRDVIDKMRTDGILPTLDAVLHKLDQPLPLGYCNVGVVLEADDAPGFTAGDRVVSNGRHAEVVCVPRNLAARIPQDVSDDEAAFAVLGAVALEAIRLAEPTLGETVAVIGLGLVGLLAVQLLQAQGCRVLGIDMDAPRAELARSFGAEALALRPGMDPQGAAAAFSRGRGIDAVIIAANTSSSDPVRQAARMCRKRGRVVLVGVSGLELSRGDFYEKELTFRVSCSYGPGRHDASYEEKGRDYPIGFVRWTEQRNFEAVLDMMSGKRIDVTPLISHRFPITEAALAYALLTGGTPSLGILLDYPTASAVPEPVVRTPTLPLPSRAARPPSPSGQASPRVAFIGCGNYANAVLIPAFARAGARLVTIASHSGASSMHAARKWGFETVSTDVDAVLSSADVDAIVVATRHDTHASLTVQGLAAGKHVFVEKPLAIAADDLASVRRMHAEVRTSGNPLVLTVGYNRRWAPHIVRIRELLAGIRSPMVLVMTVNAGAVHGSHWTHDPEVGGGRIIGEACHFVDLLRHLAAAPITRATIHPMPCTHGDTATIQLAFADGSIGTVHYIANGNKRFPKERLDVFVEGRSLHLDNFRRLEGHGWPGFSRMSLWRQDKGQEQCVAAFLAAIASGTPPIPDAEVFEVAGVCIDLQRGD